MTNVERSLSTAQFSGFEPIGHLRRPYNGKLFLPLYAVGLFGSVLFVLCFFGAVDVTAAMPTAVLITITALPAIAAVAIAGHDFFSPFQLVAAYFLVYYGARSGFLQLNPRAMRLGLLQYDDYVPTATWLAVLAFCAFAVGYTLARSQTPARHLLRIWPRLPSRAPIIRLTMLAAIGVVAHAYILSYGVVIGQTYTQSGMREMTESPIPGWLPPCSGLVEIAFGIAVLYAMSSDVPNRDRRMCKWFAWICFGLIVSKTLSQGIREYMLLAVALWVLCHHYRRRRVGAGVLAAVVVCGLLVFPTIQVLREPVILKGAGGTPKSLRDASELVSASTEYFRSLSAQDFANLAMASVLDRSQGVDALSLVVKYTPERADWGLGTSYAGIPIQLFVPRALWADKPVLKTHHEFERTYMGISFFAQASPHVLADFYSNFAVFGLIGGALLIGFAFKYFYLMLMCSPWRKEILFVYCYIILNAVHELEADFVAGTVIMVRAIIMIAFALVFLSFGQNQSTDAASA